MNNAVRKIRHFPLILFSITLCAAGLRLYRLDAESLYMDEIVTVETFHRDPQGVIVSAAMVGQPPLDNFVGATIYRLGLGQSDWWVRLPAMVFGAAAVFLLGLWVRRIGGEVAGIAAALLLAVCPMHVAMSQEVRPYALMFFLALACGLCYVRARERDRAVDWILFAVVMFAMLMTRWTDPHFVVLGIGLHALFERRQARKLDVERQAIEASKLWRTALSTFAAYLFYSPFFWIVLRHQPVAIRPAAGDWTTRFASLLYEGLAALFAGYSTRTVYVALPGSRWLIVTGALLALIGLLATLVRRKRADCAFWWIFVPFPLVYAFVYALVGNAIPKPQYLLVMAVLVFACIGLALDTARKCLKRPILQHAFLSVMLLFLAVPMTRASWDGLVRIDKRDWRGAMGFLKEHAQPGDVGVCMGSDTATPAFVPKAYGKDRYGPEHLRLIPVSTETTLDAFAGAGWGSSSNTVWMLVYTDRMYTGVDHVVPPKQRAGVLSIRSFNGLFLVELRSAEPAIERLMDTVGEWYAVLPVEASIPAPALLRWRYAVSHSDTVAAAESLAAARRQCTKPGELAALEQVTRAGEALAATSP
jgi:hypothetical protein